MKTEQENQSGIDGRAKHLVRNKEARVFAAQTAARGGEHFTRIFAEEFSESGLSLYGLVVTLGVGVTVRPTSAEWLRIFNYLTLPQAIQGKDHSPVSRLAIVARALDLSAHHKKKRRETHEPALRAFIEASVPAHENIEIQSNLTNIELDGSRYANAL